jgi:hypothetical protein
LPPAFFLFFLGGGKEIGIAPNGLNLHFVVARRLIVGKRRPKAVTKRLVSVAKTTEN